MSEARRLVLGAWQCHDLRVIERILPFSSLRHFFRHRPAAIGVGFLMFLLLLFLFESFVSGRSPTQITDQQFSAPSWEHWFGTDIHGRDLFSRTVFGLRLSLVVGVLGAMVSLVIGTVWGGVAAYSGGRKDALMMRVVDILYAMPSIIFVIVLMAAYDGMGRSLVERGLRALGVTEVSAWAATARLLLLYVGLGAVSWLTVARIVRGEVLALRERTFVLASQVLGAAPGRILWRHLLPNLVGVLIVYLTLTIPTIILYESFLSYLGLGIQPPYGSLGSLISEGAQQINPIRIYWWMIVFPGAALVLTLLAINFVGDGLRALFNLERSDPGS